MPEPEPGSKTTLLPETPDKEAMVVLKPLKSSVAPAFGRLTAELVQKQIEKGGASKYLQTQCAMDTAQ